MLAGVAHAPYGQDNLYKTDPTDRFPRDPMAGDTIYVKAKTWPVEDGQTVWVTWTKNGVQQPAVGAAWQYQANAQSFWQATLGPFVRGDQITYQVHANENEANEQVTGSFSFSVTSWSAVTDVLSFTDNGTSVDLVLGDSNGSTTPRLRFGFPTADSFRMQFSPSGAALGAGSDPANYHVHDHANVLNISTADLVLSIQKSPYRLSVYRADGTTLVAQSPDPAVFRSLGWASDGKTTINQIEDHFRVGPADHFYGFGERYDYFDQRGRDVSTYIYNEYGDQAATDRTYYASPFFLCSAGYGIYVASTATSVFNVGTFRSDLLGFTVPTFGESNPRLEYVFFAGQPKTVLDRYTALTGRPALPPKWAFGLWISANEWHTQGQVTDNLNAADANQIPITVLVLEQWSDEATVYVWHGAQYTPRAGGEAPRYADFTFPPGGEWQDPKAMVADAHRRGVRIVLWQIAALKQNYTVNPTTIPPQMVNDSKYAQEKGYLVTDGAGKPYRVPKNSWYGNSLVPDFTNPDAAAWWFSKRAYLVDEVGIDGFKNDYGEMVFGRNTTFADGSKGVTMHNGYARSYMAAYQRYLQKARGADSVLLARAGTSGSQALSIYWAGDQLSSFDSFRVAVRAGLSAGQSGVAYWGWDLAGFANPFPSSELFLRATAMATFCPLMQLHSQYAADTESRTRTPWHVQEVTGDTRVIPTFRKFANVRMNLLPYIYSEAQQSAVTGAPMMRAMSLEFPDDPATGTLDDQYMFGGQLLIAPLMQPGMMSRDFHVPAGEWYDLWNAGQFAGPATKSYGADLDMIPVYARPGAVIPLNLDASYQLGSAVGNGVGPYGNLTLRVYPGGRVTYPYFDDSAGQVVDVEVNTSWTARQITVEVPKLSVAATLQIIAGLPGGVVVSGAPLAAHPTMAAFQAATTGWFWDPVLQATLVKLPQASLPAAVTLAEVDKAAYQALFAAGQGTTTNTNHANYTGLGFVDGFDQPGDAVTFSVWADVAGTHWLRFRYANAGGADATRTVYVDGNAAATLTMFPLANWDTWGTADVAAKLTPGAHQVRVSFDGGDTGAINLNGLTLVAAPAATAAVLTHHNDNRRSGANLQETILNTANVSPATFGKRWSYPVQGQVYAQPLYTPNVAIPGKGHRNVLFVATMHNRVYAFDADDPLQAETPLWQRKLEPPIMLPDPNIGPTYIDKKKDTGNAKRPDGTPVYQDFSDQIGIISTPAISLTQNVMYVVTTSHDPSKAGPDAYSHHLHALDLATGQERLGGPVKIQASVKGQGYTGEFGEPDTVAGGKVQFVSHRQNQRPGLLLVDDALYIAFASYGDKDAYHGWLLAYDAGTLQQKAAFNTSPSALDSGDPDNIGRGGIWQGGEGPAADDQGNVYVLTGNGGYRNETDFSDCFVKLRAGDLKVLDWFTPFNQDALSEYDLDVGSAGALLLPDTDLLVGGGKESKLFVIRTSAMGKYLPDAGNSQIQQHFYVHVPTDPTQPLKSAAKSDGTGHHIHGSPAYWRGPDTARIYVWAEDDVIKAYALGSDGKVPATPLALTGIPNAQLGTVDSQGAAVGLGNVSGVSQGMPGGQISISADGQTEGSGVVWACHPTANANKAIVAGLVRAFDATDLGRELWNSAVNPERDEVGAYAKFCPPTVANGRVYVATFSGAVVVYGLLDGAA